MAQFLEQIMALPTVVLTAVLGIVFVYWLFVIVGALDIDMVDIGGDLDGLAEGAAEGGLEAAAEGIEGAAEGIEGAAEGIEGAAEGIEGAGGVGEAAEGVEAGSGASGGLSDGLSLLSFMTWLGLRNAPFTVVFSLIILFAWSLTLIGMRYFAPAIGGGALAGLTVVSMAFIAAIPMTSVLSRPLGPLFHIRAAEGRRDLVGRTCVIETGSVDPRFGVATVHEGGRWPRIEVRANASNRLRRGDEALIVDYDPVDETFRVEALTSDGPGHTV